MLSLHSSIALHGVVVGLAVLMYLSALRARRQRRQSAGAVAWLLSIIAVPYIGLPLFLLFGTRKLALAGRPPHATLAPVGVQVDGPAWLLPVLAAMGLPPPRAVAVRWHDDGPAALVALLGVIDGASQRLDLCTYLLADDAIGQTVAAALQRAALRGVRVYMLVDAFGALRGAPHLMRALRRHGVRVYWFTPLLHNPLRSRVNLRNHRKFVIGDGRRLWAGGRNVAAEYFGAAAVWDDLSFDITGPLAHDVQQMFERDWNASAPARHRFAPGGSVSATPAAVPEAAPGAVQLVASGPDQYDDTLHEVLLAAAYHAQRRLVAVTPYCVLDDMLLSAWCLASRRGVQVTVVLPARSNHYLADLARGRTLRMLAQSGVEIYLAPAMLHAKAVLVDDSLALSGSANMDGRSLFLNFEMMVAFYGAAEVAWLERWCSVRIGQARRYAAPQSSWRRDLTEGLWRVLAFEF